MRQRISSILLTLLSIAVVPIGSIVAADSPVVGIIVDLNAPTGCYQLNRDGKTVKEIDVLMPLNENDKLSVICPCEEKGKAAKAQETFITLQLASGEKVLTCKDGTYVLKKEQPLSLLGNIVDFHKEWISSWFKGLHNSYYHARLTSLAVRGHDGRLFTPLVGHTRVNLAAGMRDLHLAWSGGVSPYALRISNKKGVKPFVEMNGLKHGRVLLKGVTLDVGDYTLEIEDSRGQRLIRDFQTIPPEKVPRFPHQESSEMRSKTEKQLYETIYAAWLIEQDPLLWSLEAYQRVSKIASDFYPAELLRLRLEGDI